MNAPEGKHSRERYSHLMLTDRRIAIVILLAWLTLLVACFTAAGGLGDNTLIRFNYGPSPDLRFLGIVIDTWAKWEALGIFMAVDMGINVWANEIIGPWIGNTIYDHKEPRLEYSHATSMAITNLYFVYSSLRGIMTVYVAFTQIDIVLIRILVDVVVTLFTSWAYIMPKVHAPPEDGELTTIRVVSSTVEPGGTYGAC